MKENLKWIILGGIFIIPFIVFLVPSSLLFPFITGKNLAFRFLVELVGALWLILITLDKEYRPKFSWLLGSVLIFTAIIGLADLFAENSSKALWSNYERMEGFVTLLHMAFYFVVAASVLHTQKLWNKFLYTWIGVSLIMCVYGTFQLAGKLAINQGGVRVDGSFGNATYLAVFLMFNIFFALFVYLRTEHKKKMLWIILPTIAYQAVLLYHTATRGAILGLLGGLFVTVVLTALFEKNNKALRKSAIIGLVSLVVFIGGFIAIRNVDFVQKSPVLARFANLSPSDIKTQGRYYIWPMAIEGFKERPILGWGQEGFSYVFSEHYNPKMYAQEQWFDRAHNMFLDWLVAGGILGLLGFLSILFFAFWYIWKNNTFSLTEKSLLTGLLSAYIFQGIFVFDNLVSLLLFFSFIGMIHSMHGGDHISMPIFFEKKSSLPVVVFVAVVLASGAFYYTVWKPLRAGQTLIQALVAVGQQPAKPTEVLGLFKKALAYDSLGNSEIREQLANSAGVFLAAGVPEAEQTQYITSTRAELAKQITETPNDVRAHMFYGNFVRSLGLYPEAIGYYEKALQLSPTKQVISLEIGLTKLQTKDYEGALAAFKTAYELEPVYLEARLYYAVAALYANKETLANELFAGIDEQTLIYDDKVAQALAQTGRFNELTKIFIRRIAEGKDTYENNISLAVTYLRVGNRAQSVAVLKRFAAKDSTRKAELDYYISEIEAGRNP